MFCCLILVMWNKPVNAPGSALQFESFIVVFVFFVRWILVCHVRNDKNTNKNVRDVYRWFTKTAPKRHFRFGALVGNIKVLAHSFSSLTTGWHFLWSPECRLACRTCLKYVKYISSHTLLQFKSRGDITYWEQNSTLHCCCSALRHSECEQCDGKGSNHFIIWTWIFNRI